MKKEFKRKATKKEIENKIIPKYVKLGTSAQINETYF